MPAANSDRQARYASVLPGRRGWLEPDEVIDARPRRAFAMLLRQ